jgi:hypothetical protein
MSWFCPGFFGEKRRRVVIELKTSIKHVIGINRESGTNSNNIKYFFQVDNLTRMYDANKCQYYHQRKETDEKMIEIGNALSKNKNDTPNEKTPLLKK